MVSRRFLTKKIMGGVTLAICTATLVLGLSNTSLAAKKEYIDLSHVEEAQMPVDPSLLLPELKFFGRVGVNGGKHNLEVISYCPHTGTHMDSPFHVIADKASIEAWPADILIGHAVVITAGHAGNYVITQKDIQDWEKKYGAIKANDGVLLHTGHDANWTKGYEAYIKNGYPTISVEAAKYLAAKKIRYIAVESISPEGDSTEVHKVFLGQGIPVIENVCNLGRISNKRVKTVGTFPAVKGATGVWVRLLAVEKKK
jgi:kynurenine formamidase